MRYLIMTNVNATIEIDSEGMTEREFKAAVVEKIIRLTPQVIAVPDGQEYVTAFNLDWQTTGDAIERFEEGIEPMKITAMTGDQFLNQLNKL